MIKREAALLALACLDRIATEYQHINALGIYEPIIRTVIMAQKTNCSIAEDVAKWGRIKDEEPVLYMPARSRR